MRTIFIYTLSLMAVFSALWVTPPPVYAANVNYVPLAPIDVTGSEFKTGQPCQAPTCFPRYLRTIYNIGIVLAGLFAVVSIVRGGFELMFTDSILGHSEGKGIILRALGGLLIVYSSYILMNAINPALGRDLDLALQFPRITIRETPSTLSVVSFSQYEENVRTLVEDKQKTIAGAQTEISTLQTQLDKAIVDKNWDEADRLAEEIMYQERTIIINRASIITNTALLEATRISRAQTFAEITAALLEATKENGGIDKLRGLYALQRTDLAGNFQELANSFSDEFQRVMALHDIAANNFINRTAFRWVPVDDREVNRTIEAQIYAIEEERKKQATALINLNAETRDNATASNFIIQQKNRIDALAQSRRCGILEACKAQGFCKTVLVSGCNN